MEQIEAIIKLFRTENPETSKVAAEKMVKSGALNRQEEMVYKTIKYYNKVYGHNDFTTKDIARWMAYPNIAEYYKAYDICRKRFSGLRDKGKIETTGDVREGCRVWRLKNENQKCEN